MTITLASSGYLQVSSSVPDHGDDYTMMGWFRRSDWSTGVARGFLWCGDTGGSGDYDEFSYTDTQLLLRSFHGGYAGGADSIAHAGVLTDGEWHHVALVHDGNETRAYVDGVEEMSATCTNSSRGTTSICRFGANDWGEHHNGEVAHAKFFDQALTVAELLREMQSGRPVLESDGYWPIRSTGTQTDESGKGRSLSETGSGSSYAGGPPVSDSPGAIAYVVEDAAPSSASSSGSASLPTLSASGAASGVASSTGSSSLPTLSATGVATGVASAAGSAPLPTLSASGSAEIGAATATGSANLPTLSAAGAATPLATASGSASLPTLVADGSANIGATIATGSSSLPGLSASGSGTPVVTGAASGGVALPVAGGVGGVIVTSEATGSAAIQLLSASGLATPVAIASGLGTLPLLVAAGESVYRTVQSGVFAPDVIINAGDEISFRLDGPSAEAPKVRISASFRPS